MATVVLAVTWGFRVAMIVGSACYLVAAFASRTLPALAAQVDEAAAA